MKAIYTIVGMKHRSAESFVKSLPAGEPIMLVREPTNSFDKNAVQVWARSQHVGYVKASQNAALATRIDAHGDGVSHTISMGGTGCSFCGAVALTPVDCRKKIKAKFAISADRWPSVEVEE